MPRARKDEDDHALGPKALAEAEERLGYEFKDRSLLARAFCHSSTANEGYASNERLEFLGDAILDMLVSWFLYEARKDATEGELSQRRAQMTSGAALATIGVRLRLGELLRTGKGQDLEPTANMAEDLVEACIGAIFLDGGLEAAQEFVLRHVFAPSPAAAEDEDGFQDPKSRLQHWALAQRLGLPEYRMVEVEGPGHALDFTMEVWVDGKCVGSGKGTSKKGATQMAAASALEALTGEPVVERFKEFLANRARTEKKPAERATGNGRPTPKARRKAGAGRKAGSKRKAGATPRSGSKRAGPPEA